MKIAVIGATGLVGREMLKVLDERDFPFDELILAASERSVGKPVSFRETFLVVKTLEDAINERPDIALFSAGGEISKRYAPDFANAGTVVIDNSSAWRMDPSIKLVVPEINAHMLTPCDRIVANPNCSTIQLVVAIAPLHQHFRIKRIVVSTYQSVTGTGQKALDQLLMEREGKSGEKAYPYPIDLNCIPQCDVFMDNGYTKEEMKMVNETKKILSDDTIGITATTVRVPVTGGHSEAVNLEFERDFDLKIVYDILSQAPGVIVVDDPSNLVYPMPIYASGKDEVLVGRIRRDESLKKGLNLWIVSDNLRKGAATNAIQIAEHMHKNGLIQNTNC
jgi:aspartate-semialdehyde dehydrogenase